MKPYLLLLILAIAISSCKKTSKTYPEVFNPIADYMPATAGSTWTYGVSSTDGGPDYATLNVTATGNNSIIDGKTFSVLSGDSRQFRDTDKFYFFKTGGQYKDYYTTIYDYRTGISFDVPVLLTGKVTNRDTSYSIPNPDPTKPPTWKVYLTITNQNYIDVTIRGKTYNNTMTTGVAILKLYDGTDPNDIGSYYLYANYQFTFAPNVGLIQEATDTQEINLISYSVNP